MSNDGDVQVEREGAPQGVRTGEVIPGSAERPGAKPGARHGTRTELTTPRAEHGDGAKPHASGLERTVGIIRAAVPLVQKVLPLLDGNVVLAVANLLAPRLQPPAVNLRPVESSIAQLREELAALGDGATKQEASLRRVENEVETVKDSLERSLAAQSELKADLERVRTRMTVLSVLGFLLLAASIAANVVLLVRAGHVLP